VELTAAQQRAFDELIKPGRAPPSRQAVATVRAGLERQLAALGLPPGSEVRLSKALVTIRHSCEGWFDAVVRGEMPPFAYGPATAAGTLVHRAIQLDVACERAAPVRTVVDRAAARLPQHDPAFARYWAGLEPLDRADHLAAAAGRLALFRAMFPSAERTWQPVAEQFLAAPLAARSVVMSGRIDLLLGRGPYLVIDFKNGQPMPAHAEDMRFYALLVALVLPSAPYRVATVFLESMEWQSEEVTDETLGHAADRVAAAARSVAGLKHGPPALTPGLHCSRCPRARSCPVSSAAARP
jgi:hypothetical protein